jgi:hypothetical protein
VFQKCIDGEKLMAEREAKRKQLQRLAKRWQNLSEAEMALRARLAVEVANLSQQLSPFRKHKKQMRKQRSYIRDCEDNLAPKTEGVCVCGGGGGGGGVPCVHVPREQV